MSENIILLIYFLIPALAVFGVSRYFRSISNAGKSLTWYRILTGNTLVVLLLLSLVPAPGELYYRFLYDTTDSFALSKVAHRWLDRHYRLNNAGVRDTVDYRSRTSGKRRVTFIGDSFTAGHGIADPEERFVNLLRKSRPDLEVHTYAENGYDTGDEMDAILGLHRTGYEFDTLVLVYVLNDIADIVPEWQEILERVYGAPKPGFLVEHSYFLNTLYWRTFAARDPDVSDYYRFVFDAYDDGPFWRDQKKRLAVINEWMKREQGRLLVVTFPFLHALGPGYRYRGVHRQLDAFWRRLGVPHLDLLPLYEGNPVDSLVVNPHDAHPNERAHRLAAEAIGSFLATRLPPPEGRSDQR